MDMQPSLREVEVDRLGVDFDEVVKGTVPIKLRDLFPGTVLPFDLYFPAAGGPKRALTLRKIFEAGEVYRPSFHESLLAGEVTEVYIRESDEDSFTLYLMDNVQKIVRSAHISSETKTQFLYDNAEAIVSKTYRERPGAANIKLGRQLADCFASHLLADNISAAAVFSLFSKDYDTFTHSVQVAVLGMAFCKFLGMGREEMADFALGGLFHDIGKNAVDEDILKKPSSLNHEEFEIIKKHTLMGYQQLRRTQILNAAQLGIVLCHHEAMDGSGYPQGLKAPQIHKYARIARIVDVYDALTTRRVYKDALSQEQALQLMRRDMKQTFDSSLLDAFVNYLGMGDKMKAAPEGMRLDIELGNQVVIELEGEGARLKASLVGMEAGAFLIFGMPAAAQAKKFVKGRKIIARYAHAGSVYGFRCEVLGGIEQPLRLLFLAYPEKVENINLRKSPRIDCFLPAEIEVQGTVCSGVVADISLGGCKFMAKQEESGDLRTALGESIVLQTNLIGEAAPRILTGKVRNIKLDADRTILGVQFVDLDAETAECLNRSIMNVLALTG